MDKNNVKIEPHLILFENENPNNMYIDFDMQMKPRISLKDGFSKREYEYFRSRREEVLKQIEDILTSCYLDSSSEKCMSESEEDCFPYIRAFTGNYYSAYESYGFTYRDNENRPYDIKNGQFRNVSYSKESKTETFLPLDSDEITKYYQIFMSVNLTGKEPDDDVEHDYMGLDLIAEIRSLDDKIEFEILSHNVI